MKQKIRCIEKKFLLAIKSNDLISIKLFQVNDNYFGYPENNLWIIDGGITLKFKDTTYSLAWNQDTDEFSFENQCFEKIYEDDNYTEIDIEGLKGCNQNKITNAKLKWTDYDIILDYTMATKKESKLTEIIIEFESGDFLQIATVDYTLEKNSRAKNYSYDIHGELLISLNNIIEINNID
ncbi:hypothetical protein [Olleya sp. HaHaR_3_96]|uniref:hypothetical protein n=1 Tax=Olleya sp. HaHaR_3_96 TaxID=2745560 RepID=UPI001C4E96C8|nr:hypothetical protein [Olleya sp. HaHaR_3_96]QXP58660.1 hypothetical protein H0I26_12130 [Olleya sp. HaHaR_3_96]